MQVSASRPYTDLVPRRSSSRAPLRVICFTTYVAGAPVRTPRQTAVRNFLLALRGDRVEVDTKVPIGAEERPLTHANANDSIDWFGEMVASHLEAHPIDPPFQLVPVPTETATVDSHASPWTSLLAISIASSGIEGAEVLDVLRWKRAIPPPHRLRASASELYENLVVVRELDPFRPVVLVDYLFTAGATLKACARRLSEAGASVPLAVCAGRSVLDASHDAFAIVAATLPDSEPAD